MAAARPDGKVLAAFAALVVLLGVNFVAVRFSNRELAPFWGAGLRFAIAAALLFAVVALRRQRLPRGRALAFAAVYGFLMFFAVYALMYWGLVRASAGTAALAFATVPLLTLLMAASVRLEPFRWRGLAGALVSLVGIALIFRDQLRLDVPAAYVAATLLAAAGGALGGIVLKKAPRSHPVTTNAVAMGVGATLLVAVSFGAREPIALPALGSTWVAFAWLVASSVVAFMLFVWLLQRWDVSAVAYQTVLSPLVTVAVAAALAGEAVTPVLALGGALVLAGVWLGAIWRGRPATWAHEARVPDEAVAARRR